MCGIIGYIGEQKAAPLLIEGLKRLEYRGYDSAGIAVVGSPDGLDILTVNRVRSVGKVENLSAALSGVSVDGTLGIGHTRWATHGGPSQRNAHPHWSSDSMVAVVHNGIIENHEALRAELEKQYCVFESETDTEVLPHLIRRELKNGVSLEKAVASALAQVEGAYAIAVVSAEHPDEIVAACNSSPLVVGIGEKELYLASDELAFGGKVSAVAHLKDGEVVVLKRNGSYTFRGIPPAEVKTRLEKPGVADEINKGGHAHYMYKEILEQPQAMRNVLAGRLREGSPVTFGGFTPDIEGRLQDARRITLVGCGTSLFAAMAGKAFIERLSGVVCEAEQAAEFYYRDPAITSGDVVIGISQSGETADTLHAMALTRERHALCLGVTNRVGSALSKRVRAGIYLHAGPEVAVASTKAFTAQAAALMLLAVHLAELQKRPVPDALAGQLLRLPHLMADTLQKEDEIKRIAHQCKDAKRMIVIGRGYGLPLALEAALKIREVAYIDAHGLSASELKHGTLALVEPGVPVVAVMPASTRGLRRGGPQGALRDKMLSNLEEVKARGGRVIALEPPEGLQDELVPIVLAPLVQLLAYHLGVARGVDVDQPRNLAKSVTVE